MPVSSDDHRDLDTRQPGDHGDGDLGSSTDDGLPGVDDAFGGDCSAMLHRLYHYLDGELTIERRHVIETHLDRCPSCFSAFDFEAELRIVITERVRARVPAELVDRIRRSLAAPE
jgi:mycothiol system anti-sigma-R factor